jgi:hypothetical protein
MERKLTTGGTSANLPMGWGEPWGYPRNKTFIWLGEEAATEDDIARLRSKVPGAKVDKLSLVGTHARDWNAKQYVDKFGDREALLKSGKLGDPWETLNCPGGLGSWEYQSQDLPAGFDRVMAPRKWLWDDRVKPVKLERSKGGEPAHIVDKGDGHRDSYIGGRPKTPAADIYKLKWDAETQKHKL